MSLIYCVAVVAAYFLLSDSSGLFCVVILTVVFLSVCKAKGKAPQAKTDGKEKVWRAGKIG